MTMSWQEVADWYDKLVGKSGHYFHETIIIPKLLDLFSFEDYASPKVLDLGSGVGILARQIPKTIPYTGIDISKNMCEIAKKRSQRTFIVQDLTKPFSLKEKDFTHIVFILSLQNMEDEKVALETASKHLAKEGKLYIVLNHPCFRIPRQTSWGIDREKKLQYRQINRYLSPLSIPIQMNPSQKESSEMTTSYHRPISSYVNTLGALGLGVTHMEEWISEKQSEGKMAKMENRARTEFPLFLLMIAEHISKTV